MTRRAAIVLLLSVLLWPAQSSREHARAEPARISTQAAQATQAPSATSRDALDTGFDPRVVVLDPASVEARVRAQIATGAVADAITLAKSALVHASEPSRGRLAWLLATASESDAQAALEALHASEHPLRRWAGLRLSQRLQGRDSERAAALAEALAQDWAGADQARLLHALALAEGRAKEQAEARLRELLPSQGAAAGIALPLAELLAKKPERAARLEALALCRRVAARAPLSSAAERAAKLERELLARLPKSQRRVHAIVPARTQLEHGQALYDARNYEQARALLEALLSKLKKPGAQALLSDEEPEALRCEIELVLGRTLAQLRLRRESAAITAEIAQRCNDPELRTWARYYAGQGLLRSGDPRGSIVALDALLVAAPESSLADDALTMQATAHEDLGDPAAQQKALATLVERYPNGDMWVEAAFRLAMLARARGEHRKALAALDRLIAANRDERTEGAEGRAYYWRARTLQDLGERAGAIEGYAALVSGLLTGHYYSQQALSRLSELEPKRTVALLATPRAPEATGTLRFAQRAEMDEAAFASALELLRVGEIELAWQELAWLSATGSSADAELAWLAAALLDAAGAHAEAGRIARPRVRELSSLTDRARARALLRVAYPHAFRPTLEDAAAEAAVPASLLRAVAREESAFDPKAVSPARAYGLVQLIVPTARAYAKPLGLPSTPHALKRPEVNLRIGSQLLRSLLARYGGHAALVPAAYNAGPGAADRWLAAARGQALDEFIEAIPYSETRRYTRRVLQSYGMYALLDEGALPKLPARLP